MRSPYFSKAALLALGLFAVLTLSTEGQSMPPFPVPRPEPEPVLPPPVLPEIAPLAGKSHGYMRAIHSPESIEVWRNGSNSPQKRARRGRRFDLIAYIVETETAVLRLKFHPKAAGKEVTVQPGPGVILETPGKKFYVEQNGKCDVSVKLEGNFRRSDLTLNCGGFASKMTLERAAREIIEGEEEKSRRGR